MTKGFHDFVHTWRRNFRITKQDLDKAHSRKFDVSGIEGLPGHLLHSVQARGGTAGDLKTMPSCHSLYAVADDSCLRGQVLPCSCSWLVQIKMLSQTNTKNEHAYFLIFGLSFSGK